jgi:hypothetical protein
MSFVLLENAITLPDNLCRRHFPRLAGEDTPVIDTTLPLQYHAARVQGTKEG